MSKESRLDILINNAGQVSVSASVKREVAFLMQAAILDFGNCLDGNSLSAQSGWHRDASLQRNRPFCFNHPSLTDPEEDGLISARLACQDCERF
jgi:hypothetical protein